MGEATSVINPLVTNAWMLPILQAPPDNNDTRQDLLSCCQRKSTYVRSGHCSIHGWLNMAMNMMWQLKSSPKVWVMCLRSTTMLTIEKKLCTAIDYLSYALRSEELESFMEEFDQVHCDNLYEHGWDLAGLHQSWEGWKLDSTPRSNIWPHKLCTVSANLPCRHETPREGCTSVPCINVSIRQLNGTTGHARCLIA